MSLATRCCLIGWMQLLFANAIVFAQDSTPRRYALLIAVTVYDNAEMNRPRLAYPEIDARAFGKFLSDHGYVVDYLLGSKATKSAIENRLKNLSNKSNESGAAIIGLWGHGVEFAGTNEAMFCPVDTRIRLVVDSKGKRVFDDSGNQMTEPDPDSLVRMSSVLGGLRICGGGSRLLIADCCRTSPNRPRGRAFGSKVKLKDLPNNTAAIFACQADEQAFEDKRWGHGALTKALLDLLPQLVAKKETGISSILGPLRRDVAKLVRDASNGREKQTISPILKGLPDLKFTRNSAAEIQRQQERPIVAALRDSGIDLVLDDQQHVFGVTVSTTQTHHDSIKLLNKLNSLRALTISDVKLDHRILSDLSELRNVTHLTLRKGRFELDAFRQLSRMKQLQFVDLFRSDVSDDCLNVLASMSNLVHIQCGQTRVSDVGLKHLERMNWLQSIDLADCSGVTDKGLKSLLKCPKLKILNVFGSRITDDGAEIIGQMKNLETLGLDATSVTDKGTQSLVNLTQLMDVNLSQTAISDETVKILSALPIVELRLRGTDISSRSLTSIAKMPALRILDLSETLIDDTGGADFRRMQSLVQVNLWATGVGDSTVKSIAELKNVSWINLDGTRISDKSVASLARMPSLNWLHLGSTSISDQCIPDLKSIKNLKHLNIAFTLIGEKALTNLREHCASKKCALID